MSKICKNEVHYAVAQFIFSPVHKNETRLPTEAIINPIYQNN